MEKEKILSALTEKLGNTSLSERTIREYVDNIAIPEGDSVDETFYGGHVNILKSLSGQLSHEIAVQVEDFKKNYKPTPTPPIQEPPKQKPAEEESEIEKRLKVLEESIKSEREKAEVESLKGLVAEKSKDLNIANKNLFDDCVRNAKVGKDSTADSLFAEVKADYERKLKLYMGSEAQPYFTDGNDGGGGGGSAALDDFFKQKKAEGRF